jgi:hypothetical protein
MEYHPHATKDYQQTKIYMIRNNKTGKQYVGHSTYMYLSQRLRGHRQKYTNWKLGKESWQSSFNVLSDDPTEYEIILIEKYPCKNIDEARLREAWWITLFRKGVVNTTLPGKRTPEEIKKYREEYREEHTLTIQCACGGSYQNVNGKKERHDLTEKHLYYVKHGEVKPLGERYAANREEKLAKQKERDRIRRAKKKEEANVPTLLAQTPENED